jgi:hypothetical protein
MRTGCYGTHYNNSTHVRARKTTLIITLYINGFSDILPTDKQRTVSLIPLFYEVMVAMKYFIKENNRAQ